MKADQTVNRTNSINFSQVQNGADPYDLANLSSKGGRMMSTIEDLQFMIMFSNNKMPMRLLNEFTKTKNNNKINRFYIKV